METGETARREYNKDSNFNHVLQKMFCLLEDQHLRIILRDTIHLSFLTALIMEKNTSEL